MAFTHLHVHTEYSLLDGVSKIKPLVETAKQYGMNSLAITDHGNMYGVIEFYKECKANDINPVLGCEVYVAPHSRFDKKVTDNESVYNHLILLAENNIGYKNLCKIVSAGWTEGFYYKPRVDHELLEKYHEGLICLSACLAGEIPQALLKSNYEKAKEIAMFYQKTFGKENFFIELQDHGLKEQKMTNPDLIKIAKEIGAGLVVTNDSHYLTQEDAFTQDVLLCIQTKSTLNDETRMRFESDQFYFKTESEMRALFPELSEAYDNTQKIADRCHVEIEFGKIKLPYYEIPSEYSSHLEYFKALCKKGMVKRYGDDCPQAYWDRLEYETNIIDKMGFISYYLIVWDFINYAKTHDIPVGPGRGSGAGSIAAYAIGITNLDPMQYGLIFERFLNPERISMPDFDVDFCYDRRHEVIEYVTRKYGKDQVSQIITFLNEKAKNSIADVGRVCGYSYGDVKKLSDYIPNEKTTIAKTLATNSDFKKEYDTNPMAKRIIDIAMKVEGLPRNTSMHAAGVLIADKAIVEYAPLMTNEGNVVIQFPMTTLEELGLVKMDFLGLRTLTVIKSSEKDINKRHSEINLDMDSIIPNDPKVYEMLATKDTTGIFQFESGGMASLLRQMYADIPERVQYIKTKEESDALGFECFERLIAAISLYRPGPMAYIPNYIEGMNAPAKIHYDCPQLEPILKKTYGVLVYQEQVQEICRELAGYSYGRADLIRRAMGKKKHYIMDAEKQIFLYGNKDSKKEDEAFVPGCIANGIPESAALTIWDKMAEFASYAFNKSHAAAYAYVSYQTAWLKKYYPIEFMAALMTSVIGNKDKLPMYTNASQKKMGINVLAPSVNESNSGFTTVGSNIRFGLESIKNVGENICNKIIAEREKDGPYHSLYDFVLRLSSQGLNKQAIESLIKSGAFDFTGYNRRELMFAYPRIMEAASADSAAKSVGQMSLFDMINEANGTINDGPEIKSMEDYKKIERLMNEREVCSLFISGHPIDDYSKNLEKVKFPTLFEINEDFSSKERRFNNKTIHIVAFISNLEKRITKRGNIMAILTIQDLTGENELICFSSCLEKYASLLVSGNTVLFRCRVDENDEKISLICSDVYSVPRDNDSPDDIKKFVKAFGPKKTKEFAKPTKKVFDKHKKSQYEGLYIRVPSKDVLNDVITLLNANPGSSHIFVIVQGAKKGMTYPNCLINAKVLEPIFIDLFGKENVKIV